VVIGRLTSTIHALGGNAKFDFQKPDSELLGSIRLGEKASELARGGEIAVPEASPTVGDEIASITQKVVDEYDNYQVRRWRVLFEDVVLVTFHPYRGLLFPIVCAALAGLLAWLSYAIGKGGSPSAGWITALRLIFGVDQIDVYSRRSHARLRFAFRKARAREVWDQIIAAVRASQENPASDVSRAPFQQESVDLS
jgi:hypothetical protein